MEPAAHRRGRRIRHRGLHRRRDAEPVRHLGDQPRPGRAAGGGGARPRTDVRRGRAPGRREGVGLHGPSRRALPMRDIAVDTVFVGSCTNGRIEDLRVVADVLRGRKVADGVRMLVVPGSMRVRAQAESEGLGEIFTAAGAEWRQAGCSMCLGMNPDQLAPGERCASTSNRNFEGRQGKGGRTHLVSPAVAAATAVRGTLSSPGRSARDSTRGESHGSLPHPHRHRRSAAAVERRHRPDHPRGVPEAGHPNGFRGRAVRRMAQRSVLRSQPAAVRQGLGVGGRARFRHRVVARARCLGADGLTGSGSSSRPGSPTSSAATRARRVCWRPKSPKTTSNCFGSSSSSSPGLEITVNLQDRTIAAGTVMLPFKIDDYTAWRLLEGLDDIGLTLRKQDEIRSSRSSRPSWKPRTLPA